MIDLVVQLAVAIVIALGAGWFVRHLLGRGRMGELLEPDARKTIARSLLILFLVIAIVLVLSGRDETIRQSLVLGLVRFMPRLVVGVVIIVVAFVLSRLTSVVVAQTLRRRSAVLAARVAGVMSAAVIVIGILLAMKQMGIETDILVLVVSALLAASALAIGLGVGLGVLPLARQLAAGRHVEDRFQIGQRVSVGEVSGRIRELGMASAKIEDDSGSFFEVPYRSFLENAVEVSDD